MACDSVRANTMQQLQSILYNDKKNLIHKYLYFFILHFLYLFISTAVLGAQVLR